MAGDIHVHCQHKEHKKVVAYLISDYESTDITNIVQFYVFIQGVTEDFQIVQELYCLVPIKKGVVIQFFLELVTFFSSMNCLGEKVVLYAMMGHSLCVVKRMIMQQN